MLDTPAADSCPKVVKRSFEESDGAILLLNDPRFVYGRGGMFVMAVRRICIPRMAPDLGADDNHLARYS